MRLPLLLFPDPFKAQIEADFVEGEESSSASPRDFLPGEDCVYRIYLQPGAVTTVGLQLLTVQHEDKRPYYSKEPFKNRIMSGMANTFPKQYTVLLS